jgi:hypothetical protein
MSYDLRALSLGAGVQSSVCALASDAGELPAVDCGIFADTGCEPESVYRWLDWLETQLSFPVYRVAQGHLGDDSFVHRISQKSGKRYVTTRIPFFIKNPDGTRGVVFRKCTRDYKIAPIRRQVRKLLAQRGAPRGRVLQSIGISTDEADRMRDSNVKYITHTYPLIDAGWSRNDCLQWAKRYGFPEPPRSACSFCPYHSDVEWMRLRTEEPDAFAGAIKFEREVQDFMAKHDEVTVGIPYLHASLVPLDQVEFRGGRQLELFGAECEGMCGV